MTDLQKLVEVIRDEFGSSVEYKVGPKPWTDTEVASFTNYNYDIDLFFNSSSIFFGWVHYVGYDLVINLPNIIGFDPISTYKVDGYRSYEIKTQLNQIKHELIILHKKLDNCVEERKHWIKERERNLILED